MGVLYHPPMDAADRLRGYIQRVAVGPKGSKDLTEDEAADGLAICLRREASDVRIGAFLLAMRIKRETDDEYRGFLAALREVATCVAAADSPAQEVVDLADPYDGALRSPPTALFTAATLAACGLPTLVHGAPTMGPKHGQTHEQVAAAMGIDVDLSPADAAARLGPDGPGWAYLSMRKAQPALWALTSIREEIVKRTALSTLDKMVLPIRGRDATHAVAGFVHRGYDDRMLDLYRSSSVASAGVFRAPEGGTNLPAYRAVRGAWYRPGGETTRGEIDPMPAGVADAQTVIWQAGVVLWLTGHATDRATGVLAAREAVVSGAARARLAR